MNGHDVRYWQLADIGLCAAHVAFDPKQTRRLHCEMSAYDPKRTCTRWVSQLLRCRSSRTLSHLTPYPAANRNSSEKSDPKGV